jgi:uncharacterized NAD(P)/FAD-binding protein YdhS
MLQTANSALHEWRVATSDGRREVSATLREARERIAALERMVDEQRRRAAFAEAQVERLEKKRPRTHGLNLSKLWGGNW